MPKSNGRPKDRMRKTPKPDTQQVCVCGGKATKYGVCVRCLDDPFPAIRRALKRRMVTNCQKLKAGAREHGPKQTGPANK